MSYNKELLTAWDGHINVQRVTQLGLVRYLVKYVSKVEPTFTTRVKESVSEVEKYFTTRLIGAPEVATTLLSFQIAGGKRRVVFLDTNLPGQLNKVLKPKAHIRRLEDESTDVFWDSSVTSTPPGPTALSESRTQNTWRNGRCLLLSPKFPRGVGTGLWWTERREWPLLVTARYCLGGGYSPRLTGTSTTTRCCC